MLANYYDDSLPGGQEIPLRKRTSCAGDGEHEETKDECDDVGINVDEMEKELIPVLKEGYLYKKKQKGVRLGMFNWQHRYCVMDNVLKLFKYGTHESSLECRSIPFHEIKSAYISREGGQNADKFAQPVAGGLQFEVEIVDNASNKNSDRVFTFRAQDPLDAANWVKVFHSISVDGKAFEDRDRNMAQTIESSKNTLIIRRGEADPPVKNDVFSRSEGKYYDDFERKETDEVSHFEVDTSTPDPVDAANKEKLASITKRILARASERQSASTITTRNNRRAQRKSETDSALPSSNTSEPLKAPKDFLYRALVSCCFKGQKEPAHDD
mmetsp:Transcript_12995/g.23420  ORF Transcript_12995/g.23420 Transcript_12995/m.23420 type:complete len:326 (-) Transcript_12995:29-1006(-)